MAAVQQDIEQDGCRAFVAVDEAVILGHRLDQGRSFFMNPPMEQIKRGYRSSSGGERQRSVNSLEVEQRCPTIFRQQL